VATGRIYVGGVRNGGQSGLLLQEDMSEMEEERRGVISGLPGHGGISKFESMEIVQ